MLFRVIRGRPFLNRISYLITMNNHAPLLIESWLPIEAIGAESLRDASAARKPPLNRLHVWLSASGVKVPKTSE